jgi:membrane protein YqaA with SNARE-associated domain
MNESITQRQGGVIEGAGSSFDRFLSSRAAIRLAFVWGVAEASFFFIVPDVLLTFVACRALKPALKATIAALAGALIGGVGMYAFGLRAPHAASAFLDHVPAINADLIARVARQIDEHGLIAVMIGPLKGIPYKIYAVEWGAQGRSLIGFLLISIPARYIRFFLAAVVARLIARLIEPVTRRRRNSELLIIAAIWIVFYGYYFSRFGL